MKKAIKSIFKRACKIICILSSFFVLLAFTDIPYWAYYSLASVEETLTKNPEYIIIMGGGGMPSPSGLMRSYHGAQKAKAFPNAKIYIAMPSNQNDSSKQLKLMAHELVLKGIDTTRIQFAQRGFNTRSQAVEISEMIENKSASLLLITSPEHMYRCIHAFRKVGFKDVGGDSAFEVPNDKKQLKDKDLKDKLRVKNLTLRYNLWSYMQYEIVVVREYIAISYYWFKGWI